VPSSLPFPSPVDSVLASLPPVDERKTDRHETHSRSESKSSARVAISRPSPPTTPAAAAAAAAIPPCARARRQLRRHLLPPSRRRAGGGRRVRLRSRQRSRLFALGAAGPDPTPPSEWHPKSVLQWVLKFGLRTRMWLGLMGWWRRSREMN